MYDACVHHVACVYDPYMYDALLNPWPRSLYLWCVYPSSSTLDTMHVTMMHVCACVYDAHVLDADECMYTCMMHKSMMQGFFVTDQRTNQQADYRSSLWCMCVWCLYLWSMILDLDKCVYDAKCLMHISTSRCCMYEWCIYIVHFLRSVSLVCMMHVSIIFDLWP